MVQSQHLLLWASNIWIRGNRTPNTPLLKKENGMAKVLIIEDDEHIWRLIEYKLKKEKHNLVWARDGLMALEILKTIKPDLIISDVMIPHMDGIQILKKIKADGELTVN